MASKVGSLIKEARTKADMTQEKLARKIAGLSADDISAAERGEKELTQAQLKAIAKATGITQASLLEAAKSGTKKAAAKTSTAKKTTAGKTAAKKTAAKKPATPSNAGITMRVTSAEKKLIEYYRAADSAAKKAAAAVLKGEASTSVLGTLLGGGSSSSSSGSIADSLGSMASDLLGSLLGKK